MLNSMFQKYGIKFIIPLRAKRVGLLIEIRHRILSTLGSLCDSVLSTQTHTIYRGP